MKVHFGPLTFEFTTEDPDLKAQGEEIMASLQDVMDATHRTGEAARAEIARVAEDVEALKQKILDLSAQVEAGMQAQADLDALKAGLDEVVTGLDEVTGDLSAVDPDPNNPPAPEPAP